MGAVCVVGSDLDWGSVSHRGGGARGGGADDAAPHQFRVRQVVKVLKGCAGGVPADVVDTVPCVCLRVHVSDFTLA